MNPMQELVRLAKRFEIDTEFVNSSGDQLGVIMLSSSGEFRGLRRGAREDVFLIPQVPKRTSGVKAALLFGNLQYLVGLNPTKPERGEECRAAFIARHEHYLKDGPPQMKAVVQWLRSRPTLALFDEKKDVKRNFLFEVDGKLLTGDIVREIVRDYLLEAIPLTEEQDYECVVTGVRGRARLGPLPGFKGGWISKSTAFSTFNSSAQCGIVYDHDRRMLNAPTSVEAAMQQVVAMSALADRGQIVFKIGNSDTALVFWTEREHPFEQQLQVLLAGDPLDVSVLTGHLKDETLLFFMMVRDGSRLAICDYGALSVGQVSRSLLEFMPCMSTPDKWQWKAAWWVARILHPHVEDSSKLRMTNSEAAVFVRALLFGGVLMSNLAVCILGKLSSLLHNATQQLDPQFHRLLALANLANERHTSMSKHRAPIIPADMIDHHFDIAFAQALRRNETVTDPVYRFGSFAWLCWRKKERAIQNDTPRDVALFRKAQEAPRTLLKNLEFGGQPHDAQLAKKRGDNGKDLRDFAQYVRTGFDSEQIPQRLSTQQVLRFAQGYHDQEIVFDHLLERFFKKDEEEPSVEEPSVEEPSVEEPSVEEPSVEEPSVEEPSVAKSKTKSKTKPRR
jgi:hypothetical protein